MKVLYLARRHDYADPLRGNSFEHQTFYPVLAGLAQEVLYFDFFSLLLEHGYERMNQLLLEIVEREDPDLLFCVLFENQLDRRILRKIKEETRTISINWFCDDHWRFDNFSKYWAPCFNWVATTDMNAYDRYCSMSDVQPILTQWAVNPGAIPLAGGDPSIEISFVGQARPQRLRHVRRLQGSNVRTYCRGLGWPGERVTFDEMVAIFQASLINLNFADASVGQRRFRRSLKQVKARVFELAATGRLVMTEWAPGIEQFFEPDEEIAMFRTGRELVSKVRHFLHNRDEALAIGRAGYERAVSEHTYENRFRLIFDLIGLEMSSKRV